MDTKTFAVIGGDLRFAHLASQLCRDGYTVFAACLDNAREFTGSAVMSDAVTAAAMAETVILPIVPVNALGMVSAPYSNNTQEYNAQFCSALRDSVVFSGMPERLRSTAEHIRDLKIRDYSSRESFIVRNAQATGEGVIACAIERMPVTLCGSVCAVTGFGRTGRFTAQLLNAFGAHVIVAARSENDLAWARASGYEAIHLHALPSRASALGLIVNTVPAGIIGENLMSRLSKDCIIIDIASAPGGVDTYAAARLGIRCFNEPGLPGRYSPVTAAGIIKDTVLAMLDE